MAVPSATQKVYIMRTRVARIQKFAEFLQQKDKRIMVLYGGAGSGKSVAVAQHICRIFLQHRDMRILVVRKTLPSLKITAYKLMKDILETWGVPYTENKSECTVEAGNSILYFKSLDDPQKLKSFDANLIWIEETTELSREDYMLLELRLRRPGTYPNQMFLTFNPIDQFHWAVTDMVQTAKENKAVMHSTYQDNPFLPKDYVKSVQGLEQKDENMYRIYALGLPGIVKNIIYQNYDTQDYVTFPQATQENPPGAYGLDFGFNEPTVLLAIWRMDQEYYIHEVLYRTGMTNADLVAWMRSAGIPQSVPTAADPSRPDQIEELCRGGFNVHPAETRIKDGIDYVKAHRLHISNESANTIKEIRAYRYRETKDGRVLDEPVDFMDHSMAAMRYAIYTGRPKGSDVTVPNEDAFDDKDLLPHIYDGSGLPGGM